jgi:hypothetical protein
MSPEWPPTDPRRSRVWLRKELIAQGYTDRAIAQLVRGRTLHRVRHGAYVDAGAWAACDRIGRQALVSRAVLAQARADVVLSHFSGLGEWDVAQWDLPLDTTHITREDQRAGRNEAGVHQHLGQLRGQDVVRRNGVRVTALPRTCLDSASLTDVEHALCFVNDALNKGWVGMEELKACADYMEQWPGTLSHRVLLRLANEKIESVGESRFWHLCWRHGLPMPEPQFEIYDERRTLVAVVDFAWPERRLFVEFDGKVKYKAPDRDEDVVGVVLREKRREELVCRIKDWRCERVTWSELYQPEQVAARVRAAFRPSAAAG